MMDIHIVEHKSKMVANIHMVSNKLEEVDGT